MTLERHTKLSDTLVVSGPRGTALSVIKQDEPMYSRNSPTTLNILSYSTDQEDFSNR